MAVPSALTKLDVSIASTIVLKLTKSLDGMDTCTLPVLGLTETDTSAGLSPGTRDATAICSSSTFAAASAALLGGMLKLAVTACCCPDGSGGGGGPDTTTRGATSAEKATSATSATAVLIASLKLGVSIAAIIVLKLTEALDGMDTCRLPVLGLTKMDTSSALNPGTLDAAASWSGQTLELTLPASLGGKLKLAVTSDCCPDGSGGGGGPETTTRGRVSGVKTTPSTTVPIAATKLDVCIAAVMMLKLTDALDETKTCTLPVSGLIENDTSPALSCGS
jgi:hypothetical protein